MLPQRYIFLACSVADILNRLPYVYLYGTHGKNTACLKYENIILIISL